MTKLEEAIQLAFKVHLGQLDMDGRPHIEHVWRVMVGVDTDEEKIVAMLHDVLEDADPADRPGLRADILRRFGLDVLDTVARLSRRAGRPYSVYIAALLPDKLARQVKKSDLKDNIRRCSSDPRHGKRLQKYRQALQVITDYETYLGTLDALCQVDA